MRSHLYNLMRFPPALALAMATCAPHANAADEPAAPPITNKSSLDDALLDDLGDKPAKDTPRPSKSDKALLEGLQDGEDIGQPPSNPLLDIADQMKQVRDRMARQDTSDDTQQLQQQISEHIQRLIDQAQQQQQKQGKGSPGGGKQGSPSPSAGGDPTPAEGTQSTNRIERGSKEEIESVDVKDMLRRVWGHLPEKVREQMQNSIDEQFLPQYETLIEQYYRRLAEQQRGRP